MVIQKTQAAGISLWRLPLATPQGDDEPDEPQAGESEEAPLAPLLEEELQVDWGDPPESESDEYRGSPPESEGEEASPPQQPPVPSPRGPSPKRRAFLPRISPALHGPQNLRRVRR